MHVRRVVWIGVSALAVASWFASASTSDVRVPATPLAPPKPAPLDRSVAALQSEVRHLQERIAPTATPTRTRDLFRFSTRERRPLRPVASPEGRSARSAAALPSAPPLKLIGIAEDGAPDAIVRTAIVSGLGDVFLVRRGETIAGHYRVDEVSSEAVRITDTTNSSTATLALQ
jgi:hypothetical protein